MGRGGSKKRSRSARGAHQHHAGSGAGEGAAPAPAAPAPVSHDDARVATARGTKLRRRGSGHDVRTAGVQDDAAGSTAVTPAPVARLDDDRDHDDDVTPEFTAPLPTHPRLATLRPTPLSKLSPDAPGAVRAAARATSPDLHSVGLFPRSATPSIPLPSSPMTAWKTRASSVGDALEVSEVEQETAANIERDAAAKRRELETLRRAMARRRCDRHRKRPPAFDPSAPLAFSSPSASLSLRHSRQREDEPTGLHVPVMEPADDSFQRVQISGGTYLDAEAREASRQPLARTANVHAARRVL